MAMTEIQVNVKITFASMTFLNGILKRYDLASLYYDVLQGSSFCIFFVLLIIYENIFHSSHDPKFRGIIFGRFMNIFSTFYVLYIFIHAQLQHIIMWGNSASKN